SVCATNVGRIVPGSPPIAVLIPGDGIGPEVIDVTVQSIKAAGGDLRWEEAKAGESAERELGNPLPASTIDAIRRHRLALKGPLATPIGEGYISVNVTLRRTFDLYANVRPFRSFSGVPSRYEGVDLIVIRENTEGMYAGIEQSLSPDGEVAR